MMAGLGGDIGADGGPTRHIPVLLDAVMAALDPRPGTLFVDGTFGAGGYTRALLEGGAQVVAIDRDPQAIDAGRALEARHGGRLRLAPGRFSQMERLAGEQVDGVVLDIGVSSMQLDEAARGFSFQREGPLDMRMGSDGVSAADIVNRCEAGALARIFRLFGEERHAGRIARGIERRRSEKPFETTAELAQLVERVVGRRPGDRIHPATRVFQALRIAVNDELGELARGLFAAERAIHAGGVLAVVTFHSLEDRIVKRFLAARSGARAVSRHLPQTAAPAQTFEKPARPATAGEQEALRNPRARSARLRWARRTGAAADVEDLDILRMPALFEAARLNEKVR